MTDVPMPATPSEPDGEPDFDAFLRESTEQAERAELYQKLSQAYMTRLLVTARKYDVDIYPEEGVENPMEDQDLCDRMAFRDHVFETIVGTLMIYEQAVQKDDVATVLELEEAKKSIIATYMVTGRLSTGDPWYQLIDEMLPGAGLNPDNIDDMPYVVEAMAAYEAELESRPEREIIYQEVGDFMEAYAVKADLDLDTATTIALAITRLFEFKGDDEIGLMAGIDELSRTHGIRGKYLLELRTLAVRIFEINARS